MNMLELEEVLGRRVDLGEYSVIKPIIKEQINSIYRITDDFNNRGIRCHFELLVS